MRNAIDGIMVEKGGQYGLAILRVPGEIGDNFLFVLWEDGSRTWEKPDSDSLTYPEAAIGLREKIQVLKSSMNVG